MKFEEFKRVGGSQSPSGRTLSFMPTTFKWTQIFNTGRERLIRSHSSARFCFELSGNLN